MGVVSDLSPALIDLLQGVEQDLVGEYGYVRVDRLHNPLESDDAGLIRSSDRGTLLLDEIGDLPLAAQAALRSGQVRCSVPRAAIRRTVLPETVEPQAHR